MIPKIHPIFKFLSDQSATKISTIGGRKADAPSDVCEEGKRWNVSGMHLVSTLARNARNAPSPRMNRKDGGLPCCLPSASTDASSAPVICIWELVAEVVPLHCFTSGSDASVSKV